MASLADLSPIQKTVKVRGIEVDVYPLRLTDIGTLIAKHSGLVKALSSGDIPSAIASVGPDAVCDVIDAATRVAPGTASTYNLTAVEEGNIVLATVEMTLPEDDSEMEKFMGDLLKLLSKIAPDEAETPSA